MVLAEAAHRVLAVAGARKLRESTETLVEPAAGWVIVEIAYTGICGTDVHGYTDGRMLPPAVFGHEWAGRVSAIGDGVSGVQVGSNPALGVVWRARPLAASAKTAGQA